jgi:hypothetical protein
MTGDDYARLARLLDQAAREHQELATASGDPVQRYQARVNVDFFTAARNAAKDRQKATGMRRDDGSRWP